MKSIICTLVLAISFSAAFSQAQYEVSDDPKHPGVKVLKGIINKDIIKNDTSFKWYEESRKIYQRPDTAIVGTFARNKDVSFVIFGGTWCEDTHFILPKFFMLQEKAGIADDHIALFGVNRDKQTIGNIASAMKVVNVPTIIVMKNGKEIGRVVEYGNTGYWDRELAEIINKAL